MEGYEGSNTGPCGKLLSLWNAKIIEIQFIKDNNKVCLLIGLKWPSLGHRLQHRDHELERTDVRIRSTVLPGLVSLKINRMQRSNPGKCRSSKSRGRRQIFTTPMTSSSCRHNRILPTLNWSISFSYRDSPCLLFHSLWQNDFWLHCLRSYIVQGSRKYKFSPFIILSSNLPNGR